MCFLVQSVVLTEWFLDEVLTNDVAGSDVPFMTFLAVVGTVSFTVGVVLDESDGCLCLSFGLVSYFTTRAGDFFFFVNSVFHNTMLFLSFVSVTKIQKRNESTKFFCTFLQRNSVDFISQTVIA